MLVLVKAESPRSASAEGASGYVAEHLQSTVEAGPFLSLPGYLDALGRVLPYVANPRTWAKAGWDLTQPLPDDLVTALLHGQSLQGYPLTRPRAGGSGWQRPKETIITLPTEVAEVLAVEPPWKAHLLLKELFQCLAAQVDARAVRVRVGHGRQEWRSAACLSLGFPHGQNERGEAQPHVHSITFAPAWDEEGHWRTRDNQAFLRDLQGHGLAIEDAIARCGRRELSDRLVSVCRSMGIDVSMGMRFAFEEPRAPHGATVRTPEVTVVAGTVVRMRRAEILAAQQVKAALGIAAPTEREIRLLLEHSGALANSLPVHKPKPFMSKLNALGLVDTEGRLLARDPMQAALGKVAVRMELAQVHLQACARLPGGYREAAVCVDSARNHLRTSLALPSSIPSQEAVAECRREIHNALKWVGAHPPPSPGQPSPILLARLLTAGLIQKASSLLGGPREFNLTNAGRERLEQSPLAALRALVASQHPGVGAGHGYRTGANLFAAGGPETGNRISGRPDRANGRPERFRSFAGATLPSGGSFGARVEFAGPSGRQGVLGYRLPADLRARMACGPFGIPPRIVGGQSAEADLAAGSHRCPLSFGPGSHDVGVSAINADPLPRTGVLPPFGKNPDRAARAVSDPGAWIRQHRGAHDRKRAPHFPGEHSSPLSLGDQGRAAAGVRLYPRLPGFGDPLLGTFAPGSNGRFQPGILRPRLTGLRSLSGPMRTLLEGPDLVERMRARSYARTMAYWDQMGIVGQRSASNNPANPEGQTPNVGQQVRAPRPKIG